jgi:tetratricopeptide (TPR) repeat protein
VPSRKQITGLRSEAPWAAGRARDIGLAAGLLCLTLMAYFPALNGQLLWDDDRHIPLPALRSMHGLWRIWFDLGATAQYYPLLHSAFWAEHALWGDVVLAYHLVNVALHVIAALLLVAIVRRLGLDAAAWPAGFLFALHPVSVEAVAWISEQKSTLSAVFYLGSALVYLHFDRTRKGSQYWLATALFAMALMSKSVTATLPAALLLIFWWQRGRIDWKRDGLPLLPWFAIGAPAGLFTAWVERTYIGAQGPEYALGWLDRTLLAGRVVWFYLSKLVLPVDLMFFYPHWKIDAGQWWQYLFAVGLLAAVVFLAWLARSRRGPLTALLFFIGTLLPVLGFFNVYPFIYSYVADHFAYLASLGVIVPVAVLAAKRPYASPLLVAALAILTWREARAYRDVETLYTETLRRNPASWISHDNLGDYLVDKPGRLDEAIGHFQAALQLKPDSANAHNNLGSAYSRLGRVPDAIGEFRTALRIRPEFALALNNLGSALLKVPGRDADAVQNLQKAVKLQPDFADAHNNLGAALARIPGRMPEAITQYQLALQLEPDSAEAHNNLAGALAQTGRLSEAIDHLRTAVRLKPDSADAHDNLGMALRQAGQKEEAVAQFAAAVEARPASLQFRLNLGNALFDIRGREGEAVAQFRAAIQMQPDSFNPHFLLGLALLRTPGHADEALNQIQTALKIRPDPEAQRVVDELRRQRPQ